MSAPYSDDYVYDLRDEIDDLKRELTAEKERSERLEKAFDEAKEIMGRISYGLTLPETDVEKAIRKVLDAFLAKHALGDSNG